MKKRNITLAVPEDLLKQVKLLAAVRDTSISALVLQSLDRLIRDADDYEEATRRLSANLDRGFDLGLNDRIEWTRDSLHERERDQTHDRGA